MRKVARNRWIEQQRQTMATPAPELRMARQKRIVEIEKADEDPGRRQDHPPAGLQH